MGNFLNLAMPLMKFWQPLSSFIFFNMSIESALLAVALFNRQRSTSQFNCFFQLIFRSKMGSRRTLIRTVLFRVVWRFVHRRWFSASCTSQFQVTFTCLRRFHYPFTVWFLPFSQTDVFPVQMLFWCQLS